METKKKHIVVIGAGYGGITAVLRLAKQFSRQSEIQVHLVDKNNYHLLKTQLHEAATGKKQVAIPIDRLLRRYNIVFHLDEVTGIEPDRKFIHTEHGQLHFDILVLALGSQTNFYGIPGLSEHAFTLQSLRDVQGIHDHISKHCALAASEPNEQNRKAILRFVIGGGGLSGVELAAEIADLSARCTRSHRVNSAEAEIIIIEAGTSLLPHLGESLSERVKRELSEKGVTIMTNTKIISLSADAVTLSSGKTLMTKTLVWTGGIQITDMFKESQIKTGGLGRILVDEYLRAVDYPFIYAVGDNALAINPITGKPVPTSAQFALQEGKLVADNIHATTVGTKCKPYAPSAMGEVVGLGRHLAAGWLALPFKKKLSFAGYMASLIGTAIQEKHIFQLRKLSRNWTMR